MDQGYNNQETQWPHDQCTGLQVEKSESETWLSHCVAFLGETPCLTVPLLPICTQRYKWVGRGEERGEGVKFAMD